MSPSNQGQDMGGNKGMGANVDSNIVDNIHKQLTNANKDTLLQVTRDVLNTAKAQGLDEGRITSLLHDTYGAGQSARG